MSEIKKYCLVIELKEEHVQEYCELHKHPWRDLLEAARDAGAVNLLIWNYKHFSIVYYECEDLNALYEKLGTLEVTEKWNLTVGPWFAEAPILDGSGAVVTCEKIFDLRQQLQGELKPY